MKYRRRTTNVSKYISQTSDTSKKTQKRKKILLIRTKAAVLLLVLFFTLTRTGLLERQLVKSYLTDSTDQSKFSDYADSVLRFLEDKLSFVTGIGEKTAEFCFGFLHGKSDPEPAALASENKKAEKPQTRQTLANAQKSTSANAETKNAAFVFAPVYPCIGKITSEFGERIHPLTNVSSFHSGIDIATEEGASVRCASEGTVEKSEYNQWSGNYIIVRHSDTYTTSYAHLSKLLVTPGAKVKKGQIIGNAGSTGEATGPHLHFEIRIRGEAVNPMDFFTDE